MARRKLSKEEFEAQFDAFLQEPVSGSEDSLDSSKIEKYLRPPDKRKSKNQKLWWDDGDDDLKHGTGLMSSGRSFLKSKNLGDSGKVDKGEATLESTGGGDTFKDRPPTRGKGGNLTFRSDIASDIKSLSPRRMRKTESSISKDSLDLEDISEKSEELDEPKNLPEESLDATPNTTANTGGMIDMGKPGADTLDEIEDKHNFFKELEAEESVDYGRLNRELSGTTLSPGAVGTLAAIAEQTQKEVELEEEIQEDVPPSQTTERDSSNQKRSMLSKVSLLDSMDSTLNTTTSPQVDRSVPITGREENLAETGRETSIMTRTQTGVMGTNTSQDLEEYHRALREVDMSPTLHPDQPTLHADQPTLDEFFGRGPAPPVSVGIEPNLPRSGNNRGNDRDIGDIFREMDALQQKVRASQHVEEDVKLREDYASPHTPPSGQRQRETDEDTHPDLGGFDNSHTEDTEVYQPVTAVGPGRGRRRTVREKQERKRSHSGERTSKPSAESLTQPAPNSASVRRSGKFDHVRSSGYGQRSPSRGRARSPEKSPTRKPGPKPKSKMSATYSTAVSGTNLKGTRVLRNASLSPTRHRGGGELVDSTEAFVSTQRGAPEARWSHDSPKVTGSMRRSSRERESSLMRELQEWQEQWKTERRMKMDLQAQMETLQSVQEEKAAADKKDLEEQIFQLKQDNYVLKAKLEEAQSRTELRKRVVDGGSLDGMSRDQITGLEKEIAEQERLIAGYQTENKRLYEDVSTLKKRTRQTEERMFKENQKMASEVASLRSKLEQAESALKNHGVITSVAAQQQIAAGNHDSKMAVLEQELREAKRRVENLTRELSVVGEERGSLERHVEQLIKEREQLQRQLEDAKHITPEEARKLEAAHLEVVEKLQRKLKWYAENQELLDKMAAQLRSKEEEIQKLKAKMETQSTETGRKVEESKLRVRERAADARKIQDLERQVKEMEGILKRRHPNSLSALMMTVAAIPDEKPSVRGPSINVLESRIRRLETELASKDEEADARVRAVEQRFNAVKFQYEERLADLERQLALGPTDSERPHTHTSALERELDSARERHRKQVVDLQGQVTSLTFELNKLRKSTEGAAKNGNKSRDAENELRQLITQLQRELEEKSHQVLVLNKSLERLRKQSMLNKTFTASLNGDVKKTKPKGKGSRAKGDNEELSGDAQLELSTFDDTVVKTSKEYQPEAFTEPHIIDIIKENEELKAKLEGLMLERDQQCVSLRKSLAESESQVRRCREDFEEKIETLRHSHQQEIQRLLSDQALQYSASSFAELQSKADTQEVMIKHLREQLGKAQVEAEQVSVLKIREAGLKTQIESLQEQLRAARENLTPEMRQFEALQDKIQQLQHRQEQREAELQQVVRHTQSTASAAMAEEISRWRALVEAKNVELQRFRMELDSMLDVIKTLQKQGVVIPFSSGLGLRTT